MLFFKKKQEEIPILNFSSHVINIKEGDTILFRTRDYLTKEQVNKIRDTFLKMFPSNGIVVLRSGNEIVIIRKE